MKGIGHCKQALSSHLSDSKICLLPELLRLVVKHLKIENVFELHYYCPCLRVSYMY